MDHNYITISLINIDSLKDKDSNTYIGKFSK